MHIISEMLMIVQNACVEEIKVSFDFRAPIFCEKLTNMFASVINVRT